MGVSRDACIEVQEEDDEFYDHLRFDEQADDVDNIVEINPNLDDTSLPSGGQMEPEEEEDLRAELEDPDHLPVHSHGIKTKSRRHMLRDARLQIPRPAYCITDAKRFVWSLVVEGARFEQQHRIFAWNGIKTPSRSAFYGALDEVCNDLVAAAQASCANWRSLMAEHSAISFDGSWSQRRNAHHCFGTFIDPAQKKVVDFETVSRGFGHRKIFHRDFEGASKGMECEILRRLVHRWRDDSNVEFFVHDQDASAMTVLRNENWNLRELFDKNHIVKSLKARFQSLRWIQISPPGSPVRRRDLLRGLELPLLKWFYTVTSLDADIEEKKKAWLGAHAFYTDPPPNLPHGRFVWRLRNDPLCRDRLKLFLEDTVELLSKCQARISTQANESLNAIKAKSAEKTFNWKSTWKARCCVAILDFNDPCWKLDDYKRKGFELLDQEVLRSIRAENAARIRRREVRCEPEAQKRERTRRWTRKQELSSRRAAAIRRAELGHVESQAHEVASCSGDEFESL
jgi:hypothetical protein